MDLSFTEKKAYQNALDFLIANEPEQRLDVRLPFDCYLALEEEARKRYGDEGYMATKLPAPESSLHAKASQFLQRWIEEGVRRELVNHGRGELGERLRPIFDETRNAGDDESGESVKKPDGGLVYFRDFRSVTVVAIEVGVVADVTLWMEEFHCRTGILFSLKETPRFRYPARRIMNAFSLAVDLEPFYDAIIEIGPNQPFGPYPYRGHNWFGSLDSAFIEIFRRDPLTGIVNQSQRVDVIENGHMRLQGDNVDVCLTIEDLFPYGQEDIVGIQQEPIRLNANLLRGYLQEGVVDTAEFRFKHAVLNRRQH